MRSSTPELLMLVIVASHLPEPLERLVIEQEVCAGICCCGGKCRRIRNMVLQAHFTRKGLPIFLYSATLTFFLILQVGTVNDRLVRFYLYISGPMHISMILSQKNSNEIVFILALRAARKRLSLHRAKSAVISYEAVDSPQPTGTTLQRRILVVPDMVGAVLIKVIADPGGVPPWQPRPEHAEWLWQKHHIEQVSL